MRAWLPKTRHHPGLSGGDGALSLRPTDRDPRLWYATRHPNDPSASSCPKYPGETGRTEPLPGDPAKVLRVGTPFTFPGVARLRRDAAREAQGVRLGYPTSDRWPPARGPRVDLRTPTPAWV